MRTSVKNEKRKGYWIGVYKADGCNGRRGISPDAALASSLKTGVESERVYEVRATLEYRGWSRMIL